MRALCAGNNLSAIRLKDPKMNASRKTILFVTAMMFAAVSVAQADRPLNVPPKGFKTLFNGKDLSG